jgi:hypothetical protein
MQECSWASRKGCSQCGAWGRIHSEASQACLWRAAVSMDVHSLLRQSWRGLNDLRASRHWPQLPHDVRTDKLKLVEHIITSAAQPSERCTRRVGPTKHPFQEMSEDSTANLKNASRYLAHGSKACAPLETFDNALLPYRWLPGLPTTDPADSGVVAALRGGMRIEVMRERKVGSEPISHPSA